MNIIIGISAITIAVILFFWLSRGGKKLIKEREEKYRKAEKAKAVIIGSHPIGLRGTGHGGHYQAHQFTLEVLNNFRQPYRAKCVWEVYQMGAPKVQNGMEVKVRIDADDPQVIYPAADGLAYAWGTIWNDKKKMKQ